MRYELCSYILKNAANLAVHIIEYCRQFIYQQLGSGAVGDSIAIKSYRRKPATMVKRQCRSFLLTNDHRIFTMLIPMDLF